MRRVKRSIVALVVLAGLLGLARWLDQHPVHVGLLDGAMGPEAPGRAVLDAGPGDLLLVVNRAVIAKAAAAGRFSRADWSYGWLNLLAQEAGGVRVVDWPDLAGALQQPRRLVVLTRSCSAEGLPAGLEAFVQQGGVLVCEQPGRALAAAAGLDTGPTTRLADLAGAGRPEPGTRPGRERLRRALGLMREDVFCQEARLHPGTRVVLARGERPLVTEVTRGTGRLLAVLLDVGRLLVANQQGTPSHDDYRMEERFGDYEGIVEPDDLVRHADLRSNELPHVDLFEEWLFDAIRPAAMPTVARTPPGAEGIYLLTHDEDFQGGEKCAALLDVSEPLGARGSFMVIAHDRLDELYHDGRNWFAELASRGAEIGWHLNRYEPMPVGLWKIEPLKLFYGTVTQFDILSRSAGAAGPIISNRNHYLMWFDQYTRLYRLLAAQGIQIDSTCGSNKGRGYLLGTGSPFTPLDTNGLPFDLLEVPFLNQETWGGAGLAFFDRIFEANARFDHGCFASIFHPHLDFLDPDVESVGGVELLRRILRKAAAEGHCFMTLGELDRFERRRRAVRVVSRPVRDGLEITARIDSAPGGDGQAAGLALLVPVVEHGGVSLNGREVDVASLRRREKRGRPYWVLPVR